MASQNYKGGAIIPSQQAAAIDFQAIRTDTGVVQAAAVPETFDAIEPMRGNWKVLGNDTISDCVAAAWANQRRLISAKLGKSEAYPTSDQVIQFYKTQNRDFDPNGTAKTNGPGSGADNGMYIQTALDYLVKNGGPDGVKAVAFARVDPYKPADVRAALATFGCLFVGCRTYEENYDQFRKKLPYQGDSKSKFVGGHGVIAGGYVPEIKFVTWGGTARFSDAYWKGNGGWFASNIYDLFAVIWPEHFGSRNFLNGIDIQLLAKEFKRLTGSSIKFPALPYNSLYFIKLKNTGTAQVELHRAPNSAAYATPDVQTGTSFGLGASSMDVYCIESGDLYYIKTAKSPSGRIEIHRAAENLGYTALDLQVATGFNVSDGPNGSWTIDNGDLYFVKTRNTGSGYVEIHYSDHVSSFASVDGHWVTTISPGEADNGTWTVRQGDLFFIKTKNPQSGFIEVHRVSRDSGFTDIAHYATSITAGEGINGRWQVGNKGDLYFVKTVNPQSNQIEVHIATASSGYQEIMHYATYIGAGEGPNGLWCV